MPAIQGIGAGEADCIIVVGGEVNEVLILRLAGELRPRICENQVRVLHEAVGMEDVLGQLQLKAVVYGAPDRLKHIERAERTVAAAIAGVVLAVRGHSGKSAEAAWRATRYSNVRVEACC